jgi:hypothetical protein
MPSERTFQAAEAVASTVQANAAVVHVAEELVQEMHWQVSKMLKQICSVFWLMLKVLRLFF